MEQNEKRARIISIVFFTLIVVATFLTLAFDLYKIGMKRVNGFQTITNAIAELNGYYDVDDLNGFDKWLRIHCIILLTSVLIETSVYGVAIAIKPSIMPFVELIAISLNFVLTFMYMFNGFKATSLFSSITPYVVTTAAFIPFIIVSILWAAYLYIWFFMGNQIEKQKK